MISAYIIFSLDFVNLYLFNAVFFKQVLNLGAPYTFFGYMGSSYSFLCFIWKPISGSLSDKKGISQMLMFCLLAGLLGTISTFASSSLLYLFLSRLILAIASPVQVLIRAIIIKNNEDQSEKIAKLGILLAISFMGAALVCGQLMEYENGVEYVYSLMIINIITSLVLTATLPSTQLPQQDESQQSKPFAEVISALKNLKKLSTSEAYWDTFLIKALTVLIYTIMDSNSLIIFEFKGIEGKNVGYLVTCACMFVIITNITLVKVNKTFYSDDNGYQRASHASIILTLVSLVAGLSSNLWVFVIVVNIILSCRSMLDNSMMEVLLEKVNSKEKATVLSSYDSVQSLVDLVAPLISSLILKYAGIPSIYLFCALISTVLCCMAFRGAKNKNIDVQILEKPAK